MRGKWIWAEGVGEKNAYAEFLSVFDYQEGRIFIEISADSEYALFVNEKFVYSGQYADFPWYKIYDRIDLSEFVKKGANYVSLRVWHCGDENFGHYPAPARVCFTVCRGEEVLSESDEHTLSRELPFFVGGEMNKITPMLGYSFFVDCCREEKEFRTSRVVAAQTEKLFLRPVPRLNVGEEKLAVKISDNVYDLGEETVGLPFIVLKSETAEKATVAFGERLIDGQVPRIIDYRDFSYTVRSCVERGIFNPFRKLGCRYFQVFSDAEVLKIGLIPLEYPFKERPFETENRLRKRIYDVSVRTLKLNALERYFDCPWREQAFYALDGRFQMRYGYKAFENKEYQYAALKLMSEDRNTDGLISLTVPTSAKLVIPSFALFYIVAMEEYASVTSDWRLIEEYFAKLTGIISVFLDNEKGGLIQNFKAGNMWNFYEWNKDLENSDSECDAALNFTFLLALKSMERICSMLGRIEEKVFYEKIDAGISEKINQVFYCQKTGLYKTAEGKSYSELVNSYAILTGAAKDERRKRIAELLVREDNGLVPCTLSMLAFKYDALLLVSKEYGAFILSDIDKKYGYMLDCGATSFWETLKGGEDFGGAGSLCHGWSALAVFYYHILETENKR